MLIWGLIVLLGAGTGAASAVATSLAMDARQKQVEEATIFVPTGTIQAPLVFADGRLAGYVAFEAQLEVQSDQDDAVKKRLPLLLDAVNMRTYRTPMASGPDGLVPGVDTFRRVLFDAAIQTFGRGTIRRVVVTQATPA
jgi:hypothetical protein